MKISAIKAQVKNSNRVSVFVDGKYSFSLNHNQVLDLKIHSGLDLDDAQLTKLKQASDYGKLYDRVLNFLSIRPRSEKEIMDYGWRKKVSPADTQTIVNKLKGLGLVDDAKFAKMWVESRKLTKAISARKLRLELKQKGVSDQDIAQAMDAADFDEQTALVKLIDKKQKLSRYKNDPQKLIAYLVGQGFRYGDVKQALDQEDTN